MPSCSSPASPCVFIAFGASASFIGQLLITYQDHIRRIGGVLIVIFGLYLLGMLNINFLQMEQRFQFRNRPVGYLGSFLIGIAFAAGWTPCVGPVLGTILLYASTTDSLLERRAAVDQLFAWVGLAAVFDRAWAWTDFWRISSRRARTSGVCRLSAECCLSSSA